MNASEGKKARQQLHEDELLAQALQSELSKSSDVRIYFVKVPYLKCFRAS